MAEFQIKSGNEQQRYYVCVDCKEAKSTSEFYSKKDSKTGHFKWCKSCHGVRTSKWHDANREAHSVMMKNKKELLWEELFAHYGCTCACCSEAHTEFLEIDHVNNNGAEHRREIGIWRVGVNLIRWLKKENWPEGFQILCSNCNNSKQRYGYCPHQHAKGELNGRI